MSSGERRVLLSLWNTLVIFGSIYYLTGQFWKSVVVGIFVLLRRPTGSRIGTEVPFAPFLAAGFLLAYFTQWNPFAILAVLP